MAPSPTAASAGSPSPRSELGSSSPRKVESPPPVSSKKAEINASLALHDDPAPEPVAEPVAQPVAEPVEETVEELEEPERESSFCDGGV